MKLRVHVAYRLKRPHQLLLKVMGSRASTVRGSVKEFTNNGQFVFDLIEFWIAGVIGLAVFGSIIVTVVHGGMPWECEEHVKLVSGAANLNLHGNATHNDANYDCEFLTSTAKYAATANVGMCDGCTDTIKQTICDAHTKSLGCTWFDAGATKPTKTDQFNSDLCTSDGSAGTNGACCLYQPPTMDDQLHDVCYSIDQYVKDEHYPNFIGTYKDRVEDARTFAILGYAFGFVAFSARVIYHVPLLTNALGEGATRDKYARLADLVFCIAAFVFVVLTFIKLDDALMDNRKHLWGTDGVFKDKATVDSVEEQLVASTGFYALAVYATFLGINSVWFLGTTFELIPIPEVHKDQANTMELRGIAFRSEHA